MLTVKGIQFPNLFSEPHPPLSPPLLNKGERIFFLYCWCSDLILYQSSN